MVPEGWVADTLGGILEVSSGKRPELVAEGGFPVFGGNGVMGYTDQPLVNGPTIVIGRVGSPGTVHAVAGACWVSDNALYVTHLMDGVDWEYTTFAMTSARLEQYATRSSHPSLSQKALGATPILLPPLPEQRKIAAILSSVDDAIAATRKVIEQTERVKQGLLQTLMTRGIGHTRFKQTEIGEIPEEWEVRAVSDLAVPDGTIGGPFGSDLTTKDYVSPPGVPVIRGANVTPGMFDARDFVYVDEPKAEALRRNQAVPGDLIMTQRGASFGQAALVPPGACDRYVISQTMMRMRPDQTRLLPGFLELYVNGWSAQGWLKRHQIATGQPHINLTIFRRLPVPVPGLDEQREITERLVACKCAASRSGDELAHLQVLKRGLLQDLLTGRVRVTPD